MSRCRALRAPPPLDGRTPSSRHDRGAVRSMTGDDLLQILQTRGLLPPQVATRIKRDALVGNMPAELIIARERLVPDEKMAEVKSELLKVPYMKIETAKIDAKL